MNLHTPGQTYQTAANEAYMTIFDNGGNERAAQRQTYRLSASACGATVLLLLGRTRSFCLPTRFYLAASDLVCGYSLVHRESWLDGSLTRRSGRSYDGRFVLYWPGHGPPWTTREQHGTLATRVVVLISAALLLDSEQRRWRRSETGCGISRHLAFKAGKLGGTTIVVVGYASARSGQSRMHI